MKLKKRNLVFGLVSAGALVFLWSCEQNTATSTDSSGSMTEAASSAVAGAVNSTVSAGVVGLESLVAKNLETRTNASCPTVANGEPTCTPTDNVILLAFPIAGCSYSGTNTTWMGSTSLTAAPSSFAAACGHFPSVDGSAVTALTRTFGGTLASGTTETNALSTYTVALDTSDASNGTVASFVNANGTNPTSGIGGWQYSVPSKAEVTLALMYQLPREARL